MFARRYISLLPLLPMIMALSDCAGSDESAAAHREPRYVGRPTCVRCHAAQDQLFRGSDHDLAMQEAREETVLGDFSGVDVTFNGVTSTFFRRGEDFFVRTDGPTGELQDYKVAYTFGVRPLQQYLVAFPDGRDQVLGICWDTIAKRWFHLYPGEHADHSHPLHWTKRSQNWNLMCAECHSTALEKNYDPATNAYHTTWQEIDVSCEACHGPGSQHVAWAGLPEGTRPVDDGLVVQLSDADGGAWVPDVTTGISQRQPPRSSRVEIEMCARCHSRRSSQQADYVYGRPILDTHRVSFLDEHLYYADGQIDEEVYVYGAFLQSEMYRKGVTCSDCHDPHRLTVRGGADNVCATCHQPGTFDVPAHHHHEPGTRGASCVECHMPQRTYMVVDPRRDHSFRVPRPDLSMSIGTPNACNDCHRDRSFAWARAAVVQWYGEDVEPHFGTALDAARRGQPGAGAALEAVAKDGNVPGIARATALSMLGTVAAPNADAVLRAALADADPFVRLGGLESVEMLAPDARHAMVVPLLGDDVRSVRIEAARVLASVPAQLFTPTQQDQLARGLEEYRKAQLMNADWPESHMNLGLLALAEGKVGEAEHAYRTALQLDPDFPQAYVNLADLYRNTNDDAKGEAVLREGIHHVPDDPALHHALGLALVRLHRTDEAVAELARAYELRPSEARYGYVYAVALDGIGEKARAIDVLEHTVAVHPFDRDALYALVAFHRATGAPGRALVYAKQLQSLVPDDAELRALVQELDGDAHRPTAPH